jgi:dihydroorotate dehydrogenase electron transfer subunit
MVRKAVTEFTVLKNQSVGNNLNLLVLQAEEEMLPIVAGQFVNVEVPGNPDVFLRRPFSVFGCDPLQKTISLLVKVLGKGSLTLTLLEPGHLLSLVYPLGKGFTMPEKGEHILAVGGGSGIAPLLYLTGRNQGAAFTADILMGARTASDHISMDQTPAQVSYHYTTEDGSQGEAGLVTHHSLMKDLSCYDKIYTCGPLPMMKAVAALARKAEIFCEVSLENLMACGFGVCLCCIEPTVKGNLCVCTEGPVFNINDLLW